MELKDVILSTLAEMDEAPSEEIRHVDIVEQVERPAREERTVERPISERSMDTLEDETLYLESVKERLLVLFEGFQSPNNSKLEAKIDLTLNFLEYLLATIDARIDRIKTDGES